MNMIDKICALGLTALLASGACASDSGDKGESSKGLVPKFTTVTLPSKEEIHERGLQLEGHNVRRFFDDHELAKEFANQCMTTLAMVGKLELAIAAYGVERYKSQGWEIAMEVTEELRLQRGIILETLVGGQTEVMQEFTAIYKGVPYVAAKLEGKEKE